MKIYYDKIEDISLPNITRSGKHVTNLSFNNSAENYNVLEGNSFIIDITSNQYFHFIVDCIGQFEFLKKIIPDLNLYFVSDYSHNIKYHFETSHGTYIRDLAGIYGISSDDVICLKENNNVMFENVYYFNNIFNNFINKLDGNNILYWTDGDDFSYYNLELVKSLREKFLPLIKKSEVGKIFITRKKENSGLIRIRHLWHKEQLDTLSAEERNEFRKSIAKFGGFNSIEDNVIFRIQEEEDVEKMESFFEEQGYTIVNPADYSFIDQISLFNNASHIASVKGTGLANMIFASNDCHITIINPNAKYHFWYDQIGYMISTRCYEVPVMQCDFNTVVDSKNGIFSMENIIKKTKEIINK